jgi:hypothetical protein
MSIEDKIELLSKVVYVLGWEKLIDEMHKVHEYLATILDDDDMLEENNKFYREKWPETLVRYYQEGRITQDTIERYYYLALLEGLHNKVSEAEPDLT